MAMSGPGDGALDPAQAWEDRMKALVRSHRWQAGLLYAGAVALPFLGFIASTSDARLRAALIVLGAACTLGTFVFWVTLGPRLATRPSRPYDRSRRVRGLLLMLALVSAIAVAIGVFFELLSR